MWAESAICATGQRVFRGVLTGLALACLVPQVSADPAAGMPRDELIARYGDPQSTIVMGDREILSYERGKVIVRNGLVVSGDLFSASAPAPGSAASATRRAPKDGWYTDFDQGLEEAKVSKRQVVALFTGSKWCPACMLFEKEVANDREFLSAVQKTHVLVKLDYPRGGLPPGSKGNALLERYGVGGYPTLLLMDATGKKVKPVDVMSALNTRDTRPSQAVLAAITGPSVLGLGGKPLRIAGISACVVLALAWWIKR